MTTLKCVFPGFIENELELMAESYTEVAFYILNNIEKCKNSTILVMDTHVFFIYIAGFSLEYDSCRKIVLDMEITKIFISGYLSYDKIEIPILFENQIIDWSNMPHFSIRLSNENQLLKLYFDEIDVYFRASGHVPKNIEITVFDVQ